MKSQHHPQYWWVQRRLHETLAHRPVHRGGVCGSVHGVVVCMIDISRQPDGELCHCPESMHAHRHVAAYGGAPEYANGRRIVNWHGLTIDEAREKLEKEIFG